MARATAQRRACWQEIRLATMHPQMRFTNFQYRNLGQHSRSRAAH
jgi:hypothetical protein